MFVKFFHSRSNLPPSDRVEDGPAQAGSLRRLCVSPPPAIVGGRLPLLVRQQPLETGHWVDVLTLHHIVPNVPDVFSEEELLLQLPETSQV